MTADRDAPDVDDLIAEIRRLRLALTVDLSAAAGALDADETAVAADIIATAGGPSSIQRPDQDHHGDPENRCH
jgi:hypothetical protein